MKRKWGKMSKRVLTVVLSVCMTMSNMTVMAQETDSEQILVTDETQVTEETIDETNEGEEESSDEEGTSKETETEEAETEETETEETETEETAAEEEATEAELMATDLEAEAEEEAEDETKETKVTSTSNACTWDAATLLSAFGSEVNGLTLCGDKWENGGSDSAGATAFGDGSYVKASGLKPSPNGGSIPTSGCFIKYTATDDGTFVINEKTQKSNKSFYVVDEAGNIVAQATSGSASTYDTLKVEVESGKTYYAYMSGSSANVFSCSFTPEVQVRSWNAEALVNALDNEDNGLILCGNKWEVGGPDSAGAETFGNGYYAKASGDKPQPNGGSIPTSGCYIKYTATENGTLYIDEKTQKSNKTYYVVDEEGNTVASATSGASSTYDTLKVDVTEGKTYYAYMSGSSANVFDVRFQVGAKTVTAWDEVAAPVINSVDVDNDGNLTVNYTAKIDEYKGADSVTVIMFYEGYEASSTTITRDGSSVTFSPLWSGDYTFKVISSREGEANKESEVYTYSGYVLPVKKPIVELAQNKGEGTVYLDWINVDSADYYTVSYKKSTDTEYTVADAENEKGYATITSLEVGADYDFQINAVRNSDNFVSTYTYSDFTVTENEENVWHFATVGSAQETHAKISDKDGNVLQTVDMSTKDETANKQGIMDAETDVVNTDNTVTFTSTGNGKISDGEEGFQYFYTMLDPNTQNFKLTATFTLNELYGGTFDNQSGFGIIATDMLGYNYYGTDGLWIKCKYLNSISNQLYSMKASFVGMRNISGYTSSTTSSNEDVTRTTSETKYKTVPASYTIGTTYTFTLEKTNDAYIATCNGEEISTDKLDLISIQEDGSICVGVFAARNAGVTVSDIQFETSESTGVTTSKEESVTTPSVAILSSNTVGTDTYEYIYLPNISGQVTVSANGTEYYNGSVEANSVLRVNVPMSIGTNTVTSSLVPDESQSLTSYNTITKNTTVEYQILAQGREYVYVSPDGSQSAAGTSADPMDIYTAVKYAAPGQYIILKDGTYTNGDVKIQRSVSGTAQKPIYLVAEHDGGVIFEKMALSVIASYWHVYGIYVHYPNSVGIQISGNYNVIEMCTVEGSKNTGIQISRSGSSDRIPGIAEMLWPSYNLVKNCESFDNCDSGRNDADGFAAKLTCGEGNTFYGCIAHNNIDDGWDLFAKAISGEIGQVTIENCIAYNNGWLTTEDTTADGYEYGEGNGFKLGGNDMYGGHILRNSIAFGNIGKGITSNSCPDCKVYNCISYGNAVGSNSAYNISLATKSSNKQLWEVEGLISYTTYTTTADQIPSSFLTSTNYLYNGSYSRNSKAVKVSGDWFESTDLSIVPTRNADGTINMHSLLVVTDACPSDTGARLDLTSDAAISVNPLTKNVATSTNSSSSSESSATESSSDSSSTTSSQVVSLPINVVVNAGETKINGLDTMIMTLNSAKTMQASFINRLRAQKLYVLASVNKEVGFSIATADLTGDVEDINVKSEMTQMPGFAAGYVTKKLSFEKTKSLGFNIGIHMNVGAENVGKTAYIFQVNLTTGQPELVSSMIVNEIGNVMLNTKEISNIYVLIAQ